MTIQPPAAQPKPVLTTAAVVGVIHAVAMALGFLSYTTAETKLNGAAQALGTLIVLLVTIVAHLIVAFRAQEKVTPLSSPRDALGRALVPVDTLIHAGTTIVTSGEASSAISGFRTILNDFEDHTPGQSQFPQSPTIAPPQTPPPTAG